MVFFDLLYILFVILLSPLWIKKILKSENRKNIKSRFKPGLAQNRHKVIWIHSVSVGEVKSLKNLIKILTKDHKKEVVLSVTTPAGYKIALEEYKGIKVIFSPFDFSFIVKTFIKTINPEILVLNELEIWPNWLMVCQQKQIPVLLINGRVSSKAFARYKLFGFFIYRIFAKINFLLVQSELYKYRFIQLKVDPDRIKICGNIKADEALEAVRKLPGKKEINNYLKIEMPEKRILTFASTHLSDELIFFPALTGLIKNYAIILVPRHINRIPELTNQMKKYGIPHAIWSNAKTVHLDKEILIFDKMGFLFTLYKISDIVIMGGTQEDKIGGHNFYEPAVMGKPVFGGPYYNNFPDIGKELQDNGVYKTYQNTTELIALLNSSHKISFANIAKNGIRSVKNRAGSLECTLQKILELTN